jgi:hypothetical protein
MFAVFQEEFFASSLRTVALVGLMLFGFYKAGNWLYPPHKPTVTSVCHTNHEQEFCHWSDGTLSLTMPDGAFYTRNNVNEPWERYYEERD